MDERKILLQLKPKFNFVYEMGLPTGKKIRWTAIVLAIVTFCYFFVSVSIGGPNAFRATIIEKTGIDIFGGILDIGMFIIIILALKIVAHIVIQMLQYRAITYTFYEEYLEYEDSFLNQHKKTVVYDNVKEMEIRRSVWDRMNGYGIIIIYTNAEKSASNGLIIYSVKDPQKIYDTIDQIIYKKFKGPKVESQEQPVIQENIVVKEEPKQETAEEIKKAEEVVEEEKEFKDSLNNKQ